MISPIDSKSKYRYYSQETLIRLKLIENMKKQRFTLEEIKERLNIVDETLLNYDDDKMIVDIDLLKGQVKRLESQLTQLQNVLTNSDLNKTPIATKQAAVQGMALVQSLVLYIEELASLLHP